MHQIIYTIPGTCGDADTITVIVSSGSDATITPAGPFCASDPAVTLSAVDPGGTWTGTGITNGATGTFDPATAGLGNHQIIYTIPGACGDADTLAIVVTQGADATITQAGPFCTTDAPITLTAVDAGGTWSGPGITNTINGSFDPAAAGAGTHTIVYIIATGCTDVDSLSILVSNGPVTTASTIGISCVDSVDGGIDLDVIGNGPFTFAWDNGATTEDLSGLMAGAYQVVVTDVVGCTNTFTATVASSTISCIPIPPHIYLPNIFSPNGDNQNDFLYVRGSGIVSLQFEVYNRWGEKVFETSDNSIGWDGTYKGKAVNTGVFVYVLVVSLEDGTDISESGNITLIR